MERLLLKAYRTFVPNRLKRSLSPELKARVLEGLLYLISRPGLADLRRRHQAITAERAQNWADAMAQWQHLALTSLPERHEDDDPAAPPIFVAPPVPNGVEEEATRKTRYALNGLRKARAHRALELYAAGKDRAAAELVCRVVESLPDHRILKNEPVLLAATSTWLRRALVEDGYPPPTSGTVSARPPKSIAICLDVLKISDVHTHSRVLFSICRNMMELDPDITTHLIVTRERFVATTPIISPTFNPGRVAQVEDKARAALGPLFGTRFHLHMCNNFGLEGAASTCRAILRIAPDVVLYGGGHRGFYSNESRLVRHTLYEHLPTAFFYIQSNNQVDPLTDMIIARGPHRIDGETGSALIRIQPYPTIDPVATEPPAVVPAKRQSKIIISAIAGLRMNQRLAQQDRGTLEALFAILDKVPGSVWHLIGASDPEALVRDLPAVGKRVARGQIVVHPVLPFPQFTALMNNAALFVHPPGFTGGSGGAAVAREAGIPILTTRDSDVSGRQPPETVFAETEMKALADKAAQVLQEDSAWEAVVRSQIAHKAWIRETSAQGFYDCLCQTVQAFERRCGAGLH
ncbi:hypothetical protein [Tritonibacter scottomollicae]|uniref:Uncharacterized protein n=1 Tax=Tritonibacter scottomollicae TaxID=483013 RepID=A0A2T1A5I0_TRISK|nr:hypothetical protein [Tritonibacter scottomollicae]PRZ43862.1 hypothetical protein CLV89_1258 [Tritonibacter scottomollicae]